MCPGVWVCSSTMSILITIFILPSGRYISRLWFGCELQWKFILVVFVVCQGVVAPEWFIHYGVLIVILGRICGLFIFISILLSGLYLLLCIVARITRSDIEPLCTGEQY